MLRQDHRSVQDFLLHGARRRDLRRRSSGPLFHDRLEHYIYTKTGYLIPPPPPQELQGPDRHHRPPLHLRRREQGSRSRSFCLSDLFHRAGRGLGVNVVGGREILYDVSYPRVVLSPWAGPAGSLIVLVSSPPNFPFVQITPHVWCLLHGTCRSVWMIH